ncbi:MAG: 3-isopropylmalate dehydrogenase [Frankiales bacterium]|nr:3-isopropylmalate dehydrogenase [Frankiales bacterium]
MREDGYDIAVLPGDGIGPEVIDVAVEVLDAVTAGLAIKLRYQYHDGGAATFRETGAGISAATMDAIGQADAILLGAMGLPDVRKPDGTEIVPQIDIRERYQLFASLRPCRLFDGVPPVVRDPDVDVLVIREITEGLFAGRNDPVSEDPTREHDRMMITRDTSEKLFEVAFGQAEQRRRAGGKGLVTLFDKANVLKSMAYFRGIFDEVAARHPEITAERLYVDAGAMLLVTDPSRFDVIVTENMFGDIISEVGAGIAGGLGLAPSADIGVDHAVFQPSHGTAPDIAGRGLANPIATVLSAALMLDWLSERHDDARCAEAAGRVRAAVNATLSAGIRTADLGGTASTKDVAHAVLNALSTD